MSEPENSSPPPVDHPGGGESVVESKVEKGVQKDSPTSPQETANNEAHDHNCCDGHHHHSVSHGGDVTPVVDATGAPLTPGDANPDQGEDGSGQGAEGAKIDIRTAINLLSSLSMQDPNLVKTADEASKRRYVFWETQPVKWFNQTVAENEPIEADKKPEDIRAEPYTLPAGFHWEDVDLGDSRQLEELYILLNENYVEDDDNMFRFDYSPEFLKWALQPPGWLKHWHAGVRVTKSKKLIGFISAIPTNISIYDKPVRTVEINFLCVHKKLRAKRVAPVLIKEITRRVNQRGIFQAVYTAGRVLPTPVSTCRYWHRSLNPKKLVDVKFSHLAKNMTMQRMIKLYKLPAQPKTSGFRELREADLPGAFRLLNEYLKKFDLAPLYDEEEFRHWFFPRDDVISSFVVEKGGELTDFMSYYTLPSTVMHHTTHKSLKAAYAFYNVANSAPLTDLLTDVLIMAKNRDYDVFNALDLMDNKEFLSTLKFGIGDGNLQYYLYNWKCPEMEPNRIGLVML